MGIRVNKSGGNKEVVLPKEGARPARLVEVIEMGKHMAEWQGKPVGEFDFIRFTFDLVEDTHVFDEEKGAQPLRVYTFPVKVVGGDRSNLTKIISALDPAETCGEDVNLEDLLGSACILTIKNVDGKNGTRARIKGYSPAPDIAGFEIAETPNTPFYFDFYSPTLESWNRLPEWLQESISEATNFDKEVFDSLEDMNTNENPF